MLATSYGLLAVVSHAFLLTQMLPRPVMTMSLPQSSTLAPSSLFHLPTRLDDEDELLQEYGKFMLANMNQSVSPCEDFYEYACGNWKNDEMVPVGSRNNTFLHAIQMQIDAMMEQFLQNVTDVEKLDEHKKDGDNTAEHKAKQLYRSCMQMNADMPKGYQQLMDLKLFNAELKEPKMDWISINFLSPHGMYPLLPLSIHYSTESRKFEMLLKVPHKVLGNTDLLDLKNLTRDFKLDDDAKKREEFALELTQMIAFEKNLTEHSRRRNETESMSLGDFLTQHKTDQLNWTRYFEVAFNGTAHKEWTLLNQYEDFAALEKFLQRTETLVLRNYVKWRTLLKFYYIWKAEVRDQPLQSTCRKHTEDYFQYALLPWFIEVAYDADRRADILGLARSIKKSFYALIEKYTWLDDETKSNAKTKLHAMDVLVGYSDEMRHRTNIDQVYSDLHMTTDWFANLLELEQNRARIRLHSVDRAIIPPLMSTRDVNAYYADFLNLAFVTIGIAQLPFYHRKFPASLKFGGIGNIIGHEMAHGFDSYCYQFNYDGKEQNWWSEASLRNFRERYRCLESQYNKFIYHGVATNGTLTSGDNIADNVGTRIAYYAYLESEGNRDGDRKPIKGLDFTNKQLYFLKFAQTWCTGRDVGAKVKHMKHDVHAYEEFRVVGTLGNMPEFSEVFQCKLGEDMNPLKKCVVW